MTPDPDRTSELVTFIRQVLGCGCPDEVLENLSWTGATAAFPGLPVHHLVNAGGRLLIGVCRLETRQRDLDLAALMAAGKRMRDDGGFNRFRLVVSVEDGHADRYRQLLEYQFDELEDRDDRLHLHVVAALDLPHFLRHPKADN